MNKTRRNTAATTTKEYLKKLGVESVSPDGKTIIVKGRVIKPVVSKSGNKQYLNVRLYDPEIRAQVPKEERVSSTGQLNLGVHVLNYIWQHDTTTGGLDVDHRDNDPFNNDINNLQLLTRQENLAKERDNWHKWEIKSNLNKPRSHFEDKLAKYEALYEKAKADHDAVAAHKYRSNISQVRARIRYYDNHIEEAKALQAIREEKEAKKKAYHEVATKKKELKAKIDSAHIYYKRAREAYGKDDSYVKKLWGEWKLAIAEYYGYCSENKSEA